MGAGAAAATAATTAAVSNTTAADLADCVSALSSNAKAKLARLLEVDEGLGKYEKGAHVEYFSITHQEWLPAVVIAVDSDGRIRLDVKPKVWMEFASQAAKVRPHAAPLDSKPATSGSGDNAHGDVALPHQKVRICLRKLSGEASFLEVGAQATLAELKHRIYETESIPSGCSFTLALDGQPVETHHHTSASLADCGIQDGISLTLITAKVTSREDLMDLALSKHGYVLVKALNVKWKITLLCAKLSGEKVGSRVVVKMFETPMTRDELRYALKENMRWAQVRHPFILRCAPFLEDSGLLVAIDYCDGGTLSQKIKKVKSSNMVFAEEQILRWFTQALLALKHLHENRLLHRDLNPSNMFLSNSLTLKLRCYFDPVKSTGTPALYHGSPYYSLSPETITGNPYTQSCEIWSMGCVLYEMCALKVPFDGPDLKSLIRTIVDSETSPRIPSEYSDDLISLCTDLLIHNPKDRPPAQEALKRPLIQEAIKDMLPSSQGADEKGRSVPIRD